LLRKQKQNKILEMSFQKTTTKFNNKASRIQKKNEALSAPRSRLEKKLARTTAQLGTCSNEKRKLKLSAIVEELTAELASRPLDEEEKRKGRKAGKQVRVDRLPAMSYKRLVKLMASKKADMDACTDDDTRAQISVDIDALAAELASRPEEDCNLAGKKEKVGKRTSEKGQEEKKSKKRSEKAEKTKKVSEKAEKKAKRASAKAESKSKKVSEKADKVKKSRKTVVA